jgi:uncharacterized protein YjdB
MKQRTGRKLLGVLLTLVLVLGLMPGMGLTAYAAQETKTVTWNYATWEAIRSGNTINGIEFTGDKISGNLYDGRTTVFKAPAGYVFTQIEFPTTSTDIGNGESANGGTFSVVNFRFDSTQDRRTVDGKKVTWTGKSDTVSFKKDTYAIEYITFTMVGEVVGVDSITINNSELTLTVGGTQTLTATVSPDNATDKTVKWSVSGTNAGAVKLYSDAACTAPLALNTAIDTLTVYAKGTAAGSATVTVTSNADATQSASCDVTVSAVTYTVTYDANGGSGEMKPTKVSKNDEGKYIYKVESCGFTAPEGETFAYWLGSDGKTYRPGPEVEISANLTLTAQWKKSGSDGGDSDGGSGGGFDLVFNIPGEDNSWEYVGGYVAPQQAYRVSLAPMQGGSAALGLTTGESGVQMNVYPTTTVYVFPNAAQGYVLDKIVWSLIDGSASYDITEAKNFVMPAMDVVVYVTFQPLAS